MKKITLYITTILLVVGNFACSDFLEKELDMTLSDEQVFSNAENTRYFLTNIYTYLPDAFVGFTGVNSTYWGASRDCMTDNAISYWDAHYHHSVLTDSYSAVTHMFANSFWGDNYKAIRAANQFMAQAREEVIGNAQKSGDDNRLYDRYVAEARLLRAICHFELAAWFGDLAIIGDDEEGNPIVFDPADTEGMNLTRTPLAEALKWIADECEAVLADLPFRYTNEGENWGRVNGAAAAALRSRALLYRASPLSNTSNDVSYWQEAAEAALDFMRRNSAISVPYRLYRTDSDDPEQNYYQCFVSTPYYNNEYILTRSVWNTNAIEFHFTPPGFTGTSSAHGQTNPTQNLVDSYETINGLPIDQDPTYNPQNPWVNRDPRLEQSIFHHGTIWGDPMQEEQRPVDVTYVTGMDYQELHGGTFTGYYTKKYVNNMSWKSPSSYAHVCPIFRYAEILLNAAEAINEAYGPADAYQYVNQVRDRVGMKPYSGMTQAQLRERIQNERRIELCFEDHRFFDERRWKLFEGKTATSERSLPRYQQVYNLYGVTVREDGTLEYGYTQKYTSRAFNSPKNYFLPIPDDEVKKLSNLKQNTGWELTSTSAE